MILGYTQSMKTAISMPDDTFHRVTQRANQLGISRSELLSTAANVFLAASEAEDITARANAVLEQLGEQMHAATADALAIGRRPQSGDDEW